MNVKEFVDEYCQITGRPAYTITVDEFLKIKEKCNGFVQVPILLSGKEENVPKIEKELEPLPKKQEVVSSKQKEDVPARKDVASKTEERSPSFEETKQVLKPETPVQNQIVKEPAEEKSKSIVQKPLERKKEPPADQMQIALQMLKSIQG